MTSDVHETLIELLEDHSKPVHIHIVSVSPMKQLASIKSLRLFTLHRL